MRSAERFQKTTDCTGVDMRLTECSATRQRKESKNLLKRQSFFKI